MFKRLVTELVIGLAAWGCARSAGHPSRSPELSRFSEDSTISGRVLENSEACVVDGECSLRLEFADTSIVVLYGAGERAAPPCDIPREASDPALTVEKGEVVEVVVSKCGKEGYYLNRLSRKAPGER